MNGPIIVIVVGLGLMLILLWLYAWSTRKIPDDLDIPEEHINDYLEFMEEIESEST